MPVPEIGPDDVLVRVRACGICGSDVHGLDGTTGRRIPPLVMGHEAAGEIVETGAQRQGSESRRPRHVRFHGLLRAMLPLHARRNQPVRQPAGAGRFVRRLPAARRIRRICRRCRGESCTGCRTKLSFEQAAMIEAVSVAVHAVNLTPIALGDTAVVVGSGMIGQLTMQAAQGRRMHAGDRGGYRRRAAEAGASGWARRKRSTRRRRRGGGDRDADGRHGADVALEASGATEPIRTAIAAVRKGGAVTLVGNIAPKIELPLQSVVTRQIRLQGSCASNGEYPACIELMSRGAIRVDTLISAVAPLRGRRRAGSTGCTGTSRI